MAVVHLLAWSLTAVKGPSAAVSMMARVPGFPHAKTDAETRPSFHYTLPSGWMGDPIPFFEPETATTHLFSVCSPGNGSAAPWEKGGEYAWCHASSHNIEGPWQTHEPALTRGKSNTSADGTGHASIGGTGSILKLPDVEAERMRARYAILTAGAVLWTSDDKHLLNWTEVGPLSVPEPPVGMKCADVSLSWSVSKWRLVIGGTSGRSCYDWDTASAPIALMYESPSLLHNGSHAADWKFRAVLHRAPEAFGPRLDAPSYFVDDSSGKHVLLWSSPRQRTTFWAIGHEQDSGLLDVTSTGRLDWGPAYAARPYVDQFNRHIVYTGLTNAPICAAVDETGCTTAYAGVQTIPRELRVDMEQNKLRLTPTEEFMSLRKTKESRTVYASLKPKAKGDIRTVEEFPDINAPLWLEVVASITPADIRPDQLISVGIDIGAHALQLDLKPSDIQQQQQQQQQQRDSEQSLQAKSVPTAITMRVDDVAGVPIESDDEASADVPHLVAAHQGADEKNAKFLWRVNVLIDRTVVEAYANNGSVVISSVSDHESSWYSDEMRKQDNGTHTIVGGKARDGTIDMWATNSGVEFAVTWSLIRAPGGDSTRALYAGSKGSV